MSDKPEYRNRYPCATCGTGYLDCAQWASAGMMCCSGCDNHPARWTAGAYAYTSAEIADMRARKATAARST